MANAAEMRDQGLTTLKKLIGQRNQFAQYQYAMADKERRRLEAERQKAESEAKDPWRKWGKFALTTGLGVAGGVGGAMLGGPMGAMAGASAGSALGKAAGDEFIGGGSSPINDAAAQIIPSAAQMYYMNQMQGAS